MTPNTSEEFQMVFSTSFYALEACLLMLELPLKLFICLEVLGNCCHLEVLSGFFVLSKTVR